MGVLLDCYESSVEQLQEIACRYGMDLDIGFLKISSDRFPAVVSGEYARNVIAGFEGHVKQLRMAPEDYLLITDERGLECRGGSTVLTGDAIICKLVGDKKQPLTMTDIFRLVSKLENKEVNVRSSSSRKCGCDGYFFGLGKGGDEFE